MLLALEILFRNLGLFFVDVKYREFILLAAKYGKAKRYKNKNIKFFGFKFNVPDPYSFLWQIKEIFVDESYKFLPASDSPVIYDCGSNVGTSVAYFRKEYPEAKIKAFEADPKIFSILKENLSKNGIENVELFNKAVWINDEGVEFGIEGADGSSVFSKENTVRVESIRLKKLLSEEDEIDLLKMDIEGAEANVIPDCVEELGKVKNLFIEYHTFIGKEQNLAEVLSILEKSGFRYFIKQEADRKIPFVNRTNKNNPQMDLQLNIYAYREE
ncbi:MAG: FkbM family methyltransferase [Chlorobi bacterium]|nr:FkbM family methyltransferase [Chlorobiota bacterium]